MSQSETPMETGEFSISRIVSATPTRVWDAYFDPTQFVEFFCPEGLSIPLESVFVEPWVGGRFSCTMVMNDTGMEFPNIGEITEVVEGERFSAIEASIGLTSTISLTAVAPGADGVARTEVAVHQTNVPLQYLGPEAVAGFNSSFDRLEAHLARTA